MKQKLVKLIPPHHFTKEESDFVKRMTRSRIKKWEKHNHFLATDPSINAKVGKALIRWNSAHVKAFAIVLENPNNIFDKNYERVGLFMDSLKEKILKLDTRKDTELKLAVLQKIDAMLANNKAYIEYERVWNELIGKANKSPLKVVK